SSSADGEEPISVMTAKHGPSACRFVGTRTIVRNMEKHHESAYRCFRVGHADCEPDLRPIVSRRASAADQHVPCNPQLWGQRLLRELRSAAGRGLPVQRPCDGLFDAGPCASHLTKARALRENKCSGKYASYRSSWLHCWPRLHSPAG